MTSGCPASSPPAPSWQGSRSKRSSGPAPCRRSYRAHELEGGRPVALKLLERSSDGDERFRARFLRESHLAASLDHPNVVRTVDSGEDGGRLYLAMELVEGTDLRRLLREHGKLAPERAVGIVGDVASGLDAAHASGLVHRDVKPGNILLDEDGHAYVCDFGLARHVAGVSSLTGDRGFVGTIDYVPPEQIEGSTVDERADVYSLGCVLYECLTGSRPFDRDSELSVVFAHLNEPPPRVTDASPEASLRRSTPSSQRRSRSPPPSGTAAPASSRRPRMRHSGERCSRDGGHAGARPRRPP